MAFLLSLVAEVIYGFLTAWKIEVQHKSEKLARYEILMDQISDPRVPDVTVKKYFLRWAEKHRSDAVFLGRLVEKINGQRDNLLTNILAKHKLE